MRRLCLPLSSALGAKNMASLESKQWWSKKRKSYNGALALACFIAFILYVISVAMFQERMPCVEITLFTIIFQGVGFVFALVMANIVYSFGYIVEAILNPKNPENFRNTAYKLGLLFSIMLPMLLPIYICISLLLGKHNVGC
jgi:4-amino-4-deoxy-L-arabinose transferase-like glycosyltransferase